jgi:hypothetical protein
MSFNDKIDWNSLSSNPPAIWYPCQNWYFQIYNEETKEEDTILFSTESVFKFTRDMKEKIIKAIILNNSCHDAIMEFLNTKEYFGLFIPTLLPDTTVHVRIISRFAYENSDVTIANFLANKK